VWSELTPFISLPILLLLGHDSDISLQNLFLTHSPCEPISSFVTILLKLKSMDSHLNIGFFGVSSLSEQSDSLKWQSYEDGKKGDLHFEEQFAFEKEVEHKY